MERKLANHKQRAKNRAHWRKDLRKPEREQSRCIDRMRLTYAALGAAPVQQWCAGGRAVQLVIENPDMVIQDHPGLHGVPPVGWTLGAAVPEKDHSSHPCSTPANADVNLSACCGFYNLMEQVFGVDEKTMRDIEDASDCGIPMWEIARMIPQGENTQAR